jgi:hypothetical protein
LIDKYATPDLILRIRLTMHQLRGVPRRESSLCSSQHRQTVEPLPGLLRDSFFTYQHSHGHSRNSSESRCLSCPISVVHIIRSQQTTSSYYIRRPNDEGERG